MQKISRFHHILIKESILQISSP